MATSLDMAKTYTSYSGVDIRVVVNGEAVGSMQAISYAIQREKAPIYVMGRVDPRSFSRGKRGIAGTMISLLLDRHLLYSNSFAGETALLDRDEIFVSGGRSDISKPGGYEEPGVGNQREILPSNQNVDLNSATGTVNALRNVGGQFGRNINRDRFRSEEIDQNYVNAPVFYVDQILPFDVTIVAVNEYGNAAQMRMFGCEILNEGSGFSIDDMVVENQMTYICRTILPWGSFSNDNRASVGEQNSWISQLYESTAASRRR